MSERSATWLLRRRSAGLLSHRSAGGVRLVAALVWLLFIVFPVFNAAGRRGSTLTHWLAVTGAVAFVAAYVALVLVWRRHERQTLSLILLGVLIAIATLLTLGQDAGWGWRFRPVIATRSCFRVDRRVGWRGVDGSGSGIAGCVRRIGGGCWSGCGRGTRSRRSLPRSMLAV